ncbi:MAG TPA: hypothetical protein PKA05_15545 [Roseiflexaceae bacterium]|nr:hypothetical protein [Roseiflexaceae bacterium]
MRLFKRYIVALVLVLLWMIPTQSLAQVPDWAEQRTTYFAILYAPGDEPIAQQYALFVDPIYDELTAMFANRPATPVTLRLYPTLESYYTVNPLARQLTGIVAHADFRRNELVVIVPQTSGQTGVEIENNIRHELAHLIASDLSANRLNVGFQEGLAQFVEQPAPELERKIGLLRSAFDQGRLLPWSALDDRDTIYGAPDVGYPQALSIVAFLSERYSFARVREFVVVSARSSGYRSALERAFGVSPAVLEDEWLNWLPGYLAGGYRLTVTNAYDLARLEELVVQGRYDEAERELLAAIELLRGGDYDGDRERAQDLLEQVRQGKQADALIRDAHSALQRAAYDETLALVERSRAYYTLTGDAERLALLDTYRDLALRGQQAGMQLGEAQALAADWRRTAEARAALDRAAAEFAVLGNQQRLNEALSLRAQIDARQSSVSIGLLFVGIAGVLISLARWLTVRDVEAW